MSDGGHDRCGRRRPRARRRRRRGGRVSTAPPPRAIDDVRHSMASALEQRSADLGHAVIALDGDTRGSRSARLASDPMRWRPRRLSFASRPQISQSCAAMAGGFLRVREQTLGGQAAQCLSGPAGRRRLQVNLATCRLSLPERSQNTGFTRVTRAP